MCDVEDGEGGVCFQRKCEFLSRMAPQPVVFESEPDKRGVVGCQGCDQPSAPICAQACVSCVESAEDGVALEGRAKGKAPVCSQLVVAHVEGGGGGSRDKGSGNSTPPWGAQVVPGEVHHGLSRARGDRLPHRREGEPQRGQSRG